MRLQIEEWIATQEFSFRSKQMFQEAIKCYKVSAYNAALLFSYLGLMDIIKERLMKAQPPIGYSVGEWTNIRELIQKEDSWEKKVFETTQNSNATKLIFPISESLRNEVRYWKDRRNDSAHFKHENINYYHVEAFWNFIETNLPKFAVVGSREALKIMINNHYDESLNPIDRDIHYLVVEFEHSIDQNEIVAFLSEIESNIDFLFNDRFDLLLNKLFEHFQVVNEAIKDQIIKFISSTDKRLLRFIRLFPERILALKLSNQKIRKLWFSYLFNDAGNDLQVYITLLQNGLITEIEESHKKIISKIVVFQPDAFQVKILKESKFYEILKNIVFPENGFRSFNKGNSSRFLAISYIENNIIDELVITSLCNTYNGKYHPMYLLDDLKEFIENNETKKKEFAEIINTHKISLPKPLLFILEDDIPF